MSKEEDKKRWKEEARQLKKDLDQRPKVVKKNEVPISFPKKKPLPIQKKKKPSTTQKDDDILKQHIQWN